MINHDQLFKQLLSTFFVEFLELFFPEVVEYLDPDSIEFLDKEMFTDVVGGKEFEADLVVKAKFRGSGAFFLIHDENQSSLKKWSPERMYLYFSVLYLDYRLPVYPIVVFSFDSPRTEQPTTFEITFPDRQVLRFEYAVVQLNRLNWRDFLNRSNPAAAALMSKMNIAKEDRPKVKAECLRLMTTLKLNQDKMKLIWGFVDTYLKLDEHETVVFKRETAQFQPEIREKVMELPNSWIEEGMQQGMQQGLQQGERLLVLRLLKRRFRDVPDSAVERINGLSIEPLGELGEALLDFQTVSDLETWLNDHVSASSDNDPVA
jgi:hypothetical protein